MRTMVEAIARHGAVHGYPPSVRELMEPTGLASTSHVAHMVGRVRERRLDHARPRPRARDHADGGGTRAGRGARRAGSVNRWPGCGNPRRVASGVGNVRLQRRGRAKERCPRIGSRSARYSIGMIRRDWSVGRALQPCHSALVGSGLKL